MSVIDYACGAGHWSLYAAKMVSPNGKVLALENDINMLSMLQSKAETRHISNIEIEEIEIEKGTSAEAKPSDLVIVSNILYLIKDKQVFAEKAAALVAPGGKLLFIDWTPAKTLFGPPSTLRIKQEEAVTLFEHEGLQMACSVLTGVDHYGLVFERKGAVDEG